GGAGILDEQIRPNALRKISLRGNASAALGSTADVSISAGFVRNDTRLPGFDVVTGAEQGSGTADTLTQWARGLRPGIAFAPVSTQEVTRFTGGVTGNWRPRSWLAARATLGIDFSNDNFSYLLRRGEGLFPEGSRLEQDGDIGLYTADVGVSASYVLGAEVTARTAVGAQYNRRGINTTGVAAFNLPPGSQSVAGAAVIQGFESTVESVVAGTYAEQTVAYRERVFLTTGLRVDGASSFGSGFSTAVYPKASISWLALAPTADRRPLNLGTLRLRAAYGSSGVQPGPIDALARDTLFTSLLNGTTATGAAVAALGNSDLRPERQTEFEAGVDLETAGGRVRIEATVYNRQSTDALVAQPFAPSFGIGDRASQQINVGEVRNRGIEGLINVRVLDGAALTWDVGLNGSVNQNRLLRLAPDVPVVSSGTIRQVPGYALFGFWDRPILGFSDANGNGILERSEVTFGDTAVFLGSLVPTRQLTGSTSFGLFGDRLRIGALFDYRGGHVRWNNASANRCGPIGRNCRAVNDPTAPLDEQAAAVAITNPTGVVWTGFVEDGDFLRFRELSITYSARELARPFRARTAVLTLSARNLATFSDYSGIDPERTNAPGTDRFADQPSLPPARYFIARLTLGY
ncbi:MAG: TonB-dependent receptor domain-containing protein, partial [Gemmatimonadaceae bacterium]